MKVLYYIGTSVGKETVLKKGVINKKAAPYILQTKDGDIILNKLTFVKRYKLNFLGTMIKAVNGSDTIFLTVPRLFINFGTGFVIINKFATEKLLSLLKKSVIRKI